MAVIKVGDRSDLSEAGRVTNGHCTALDIFSDSKSKYSSIVDECLIRGNVTL